MEKKEGEKKGGKKRGGQVGSRQPKKTTTRHILSLPQFSGDNYRCRAPCDLIKTEGTGTWVLSPHHSPPPRDPYVRQSSPDPQRATCQSRNVHRGHAAGVWASGGSASGASKKLRGGEKRRSGAGEATQKKSNRRENQEEGSQRRGEKKKCYVGSRLKRVVLDGLPCCLPMSGFS